MTLIEKLNKYAAGDESMIDAPEPEPVAWDDWPDYHPQAMGCGLEDRCITDRYEAMQYGWDQAIERVAERGPFYTAPPAPNEPIKPSPTLRVEAAEEIKRLTSENSTLKASLEELRNERRKRLFRSPGVADAQVPDDTTLMTPTKAQRKVLESLTHDQLKRRLAKAYGREIAERLLMKGGLK